MCMRQPPELVGFVFLCRVLCSIILKLFMTCLQDNVFQLSETYSVTSSKMVFIAQIKNCFTIKCFRRVSASNHLQLLRTS